MNLSEWDRKLRLYQFQNLPFKFILSNQFIHRYMHDCHLVWGSKIVTLKVNYHNMSILINATKHASKYPIQPKISKIIKLCAPLNCCASWSMLLFKILTEKCSSANNKTAFCSAHLLGSDYFHRLKLMKKLIICFS